MWTRELLKTNAKQALQGRYWRSFWICLVLSFVGLGGHLGALYQPFELLLIGGAALGAYFASNSGKSIKLLAKALPIAFRSSPYNKQLYMQLMGMLSVLLNKARRDGMMSIEADIENPEQSPIFADYPNVVKDPALMNFVLLAVYVVDP